MGMIYIITFPNLKQYVGQTTQKIEVRISQHRRANKDTLINRACRKYVNFDVEVLLEIDDEMLDFYEVKFIEYYDTINPNGYNLSTGGSSGRKHNILSRQKMSKSHMGVALSEAHKLALANSHIGRKYDEVSKEKISTSNKEYSCDLPKYVCKDKNGIYRVQIPGCQTRSFGSFKISEEERLLLAMNYFNKLNHDLRPTT